ncbi:MAG: hypothetical protein INR71_14985, partial [Terriglobus roseus]|nr:hypothetical protein [Terriglobus roseus]
MTDAVTERARKLRAQYALHAQGLRSRLEMRINRIPQSLRSTNVVELVDKYAESLELPKAAPAVALKANAPMAKPTTTVRQVHQPAANAPKSRGVKRPSNEISIASDKENLDMDENLALPKKRTKTTASAQPSAAAAARGVSRKVHPSQVLSPKSHNSRTLTRSPIKGQPSSSSVISSPAKSQIARPTSPLKPGPGPSVSTATAALAAMVESKGGSRAANSRPNTASSNASTATTGSLRGKRGGAAGRADMP